MKLDPRERRMMYCVHLPETEPQLMSRKADYYQPGTLPIAGCYSTKKQAMAHITRLRKKGIDARGYWKDVVGQTRRFAGLKGKGKKSVKGLRGQCRTLKGKFKKCR